MKEENLRRELERLEKRKQELEEELGYDKETKEDYLDQVQKIFDLEDKDFSYKASYQGGGKAGLRKSGLRKMVKQFERGEIEVDRDGT
jgi:hypothetical protein